MKEVMILLLIMLSLSAGVFAQSKPDYSGEWTREKSTSDSRIQPMTIKVTQSATEIKVEVATNTLPRPDAAVINSGNGDWPRREARSVLGDGVTIYSLSGNETTVEVDSPSGKMPVKLKANFESDGKLNLISERTFKTPNGQVPVVMKETWELVGDGKTLKVKREMKVPSGSNKTEMVFTKK